MLQRYNLQVIAVDEVARQALEFAEPLGFDKRGFVEPDKLSQEIVAEHRVILVASELTEGLMSAISAEHSSLEEFMIILPESKRDEDMLRRLVLMGGRVLFSPSDNLTVLSLSQALQMLEKVFYASDREREIEVDHEDIYMVMGRGTLNEYRVETGSRIETVTVRTLNSPERSSDIYGVMILFEVSEDFPILEIAEAMDSVEKLLPDDCSVIFQTRTRGVEQGSVKAVTFLSRYIDFEKRIQSDIDKSESHLEKIAVIVDAFAGGAIDGEEADHIAMRNDISAKDLKLIYNMAYEVPSRVTSLLYLLRDEKVSTVEKMEAFADELIDDIVDVDFLEGIARAFNLSVEEILEIHRLKNEGMLIVKAVKIPSALSEKYPGVHLGKKGDSYILGNEETFREDPAGYTLVDSNELKSYEKDGLTLYADKDFADSEIEKFAKALAQVFERIE